MPNGHGGIPKWGSPILLFGLLCFLIWLKLSGGAQWAAYAAYPAGMLLGWRAAWHLHMYDVTEYEGAYRSEAEMKGAKQKYKRACVIYMCVIVVVLTGLWFI